MAEKQQIIGYNIEGQTICQKPLLDDGEVWLAIFAASIIATPPNNMGFMSGNAKVADDGLQLFKERFRKAENGEMTT